MRCHKDGIVYQIPGNNMNGSNQSRHPKGVVSYRLMLHRRPGPRPETLRLSSETTMGSYSRVVRLPCFRTHCRSSMGTTETSYKHIICMKLRGSTNTISPETVMPCLGRLLEHSVASAAFHTAAGLDHFEHNRILRSLSCDDFRLHQT